MTRRNGAPREGSMIIWPKGAEERLGISAVTRWRYERSGVLPKRDIYLGGKAVGWSPETFLAALSKRPNGED